MTDDWTHYGTHHDAEAARTMRMRHNSPQFETKGLTTRFEWLPDEVRQSWDSMRFDGIRFFACMVDTRTGEIQRWCSRSKRFINIWNNRNKPGFPWEIIIFIKLQ